MREGFLIGGGLVFAGLMLELSVGPVEWNAFRWPVNGIVLAGFLSIIAIIHLLGKKVYGFLFIGTYKAAITAEYANQIYFPNATDRYAGCLFVFCCACTDTATAVEESN